jgi:hypothetical protein
VRSIVKVVRDVSLTVDSALASTVILTLHELKQKLMRELNSVRNFPSFEDMGLGSFTQIPQLVEAFQIPTDIQHSGQIPEISTAGLLEYFARKLGEEADEAFRLGDASQKNRNQLERLPQPRWTEDDCMERLTRYLDALAAERGLDGGGASFCVHFKYPTFICCMLQKIHRAHSFAFRHFVRTLKNAYQEANTRLLDAAAEELFSGAEREYHRLYTAVRLNLGADEDGRRTPGKQLLILEQEVVRLESLTVRSDWPAECRSEFHKVFSLLLCALSGPAAPEPGSITVPIALRLRGEAKRTVETALLQFINADELTDPSELAAFLAALETRFWAAMGAKPAELSLLEFIAARPSVAEALQKQIASVLGRFADPVLLDQTPTGEPHVGGSGSWERDAQPSRCDEEEIADHLQGILDSLRESAAAAGRPLDLLSALAAAEERLLGDRRLRNFTSLQCGPFAAFCLRHRERLLPAGGEYRRRLAAPIIEDQDGAWVGSVPWQRVAGQVAAGLRVCGAAATAEGITAALCGHFGVAALDGLGVTACEVRAWVDSSALAGPGEEAAGSLSVACACALVAAFGDVPPGDGSGFSGRTEADGQAMARVVVCDEEGVAALMSCPLLVDLAEWTDWAALFEPSLGSLRSFLARCGPQLRRGKGGCGRGEAGLRALEVAEGSFVRIPAAACPGQNIFAAAVLRQDGVQAAAHAVGLVADCGHVSLAQISSLRHQVKTSMEEGGLSSDDGRAAAVFVAVALAALPRVFLLPVGHPVFVEPMRAAFPKWRDLLLDACSPSIHARKALEHLGSVMGIVEWATARQLRLSGEGPKAEGERSLLISLTSKCRLEQSDRTDSNLQGRAPASPSSPQIELPAFSEPQQDRSHVATYDLSYAPLDSGLESEMEDCYALCASVKKRLAIGVDADSIEGRAAMPLQEILHRAVKQLAADLYSNDIHFVLEIVQNADDNSYDETLLPTLEILLSEKNVLFKNNEVGFRTANVRAICNVGASTKEGAAGYIGHKGETIFTLA